VLKLKSEVKEDCSKGYNNDGPNVTLSGSFAKLVSTIGLVTAFKHKVGPFVGY
jgi:hypothetical protein